MTCTYSKDLTAFRKQIPCQKSNYHFFAKYCRYFLDLKSLSGLICRFFRYMSSQKRFFMTVHHPSLSIVQLFQYRYSNQSMSLVCLLVCLRNMFDFSLIYSRKIRAFGRYEIGVHNLTDFDHF